MDFAVFSRAIRNRWEKPCVSHVVKYTIKWKSDGRKVPICWGGGGIGTNFPSSSNLMDFTAFSHAKGN